jgi:acetylornithine deacetylase
VIEMRDAERRALDALDVEGMTKYLCELISRPSYGGSETQAQNSIAGAMRRIGLEVETWPIDIDALRSHPAFSMSIPRAEGLGVLGTYGKGGGRSLMFNGHIDVVSGGDESKWWHPPFEGTVDGGRVWGRGASDMKGGTVSALFALKAVIDSGSHLKGKVLFESVIGEEDGSVGTLDAVVKGIRADAAIVPEPSELVAVPAHAGAMSFRVTIQGRAAHAAIRAEGVSAIEKFLPVYEALKRLEADRTARIRDPLYKVYPIPSPLNVGKIEGGEWPGIVPEKLYFEARVGVHTDETTDQIKGQVESAVERAAKSDPWLKDHVPMVDWSDGYRFDAAKIPADHPIMEIVKEAYHDVTGSPTRVEGRTYSSDMRFLVNILGIPTMIFGPGDIREAHAANESISVADMETAAKTMILSILRWCG